jgi:hypothetical protein
MLHHDANRPPPTRFASSALLRPCAQPTLRRPAHSLLAPRRALSCRALPYTATPRRADLPRRCDLPRPGAEPCGAALRRNPPPEPCPAARRTPPPPPSYRAPAAAPHCALPCPAAPSHSAPCPAAPRPGLPRRALPRPAACRARPSPPGCALLGCRWSIF